MLKKLPSLTIILTFFLYNFNNLSFAQEGPFVGLNAQVQKINQSDFLILTLEHQKGWHTYWKNPGDAGTPTEFSFKINGNPTKLKSYPWPLPQRYIEAGDILAYGYQEIQHWYFLLPSDFLQKELEIHAKWLVCKDICIPEEQTILLNLAQSKTSGHLTDEQIIIDAFKNLPELSTHSEGVEVSLLKVPGEDQFLLFYQLQNVKGLEFWEHKNLLTPYPHDLLDFKQEKLVLDKKTNTLYGKMLIDWDGAYQEPPYPIPSQGSFVNPIALKLLIQKPGEKAKINTTMIKNFSLTGHQATKELFTRLKNTQIYNSTEMADSTSSWPLIILFAFLGGIILNLMPCVLPVISLKLFGLLAHRDEGPKQILRHNIFYSLGILSSFWALATVVWGLKASGEQVGWGLQLQSPGFVFIMLMVIYIMALNMMGLFEFVTPGGRRLGNIELKQGVAGDFLSGVLATILSTPCSAPFLGVALGFAFTQGILAIFIVFTFIALGLAFPFIVTGFFPQLISFLPKPGLWMEKLKAIMGLTLLLTSLWLYHILSALIDMNAASILIHLILIMSFFAFYFRKFISKVFIWNILIFSVPLILTTILFTTNSLDLSNNQKSTEHQRLSWDHWSEENMQMAVSNGQWLFIDFTAEWCLTCKVNKKLVLETDAFAKLVKKHNILLQEGDWTKRDATITQFLARYKIAGVPAYFLQAPNGELYMLGETISINEIKEYLEK